MVTGPKLWSNAHLLQITSSWSDNFKIVFKFHDIRVTSTAKAVSESYEASKILQFYFNPNSLKCRNLFNLICWTQIKQTKVWLIHVKWPITMPAHTHTQTYTLLSLCLNLITFLGKPRDTRSYFGDDSVMVSSTIKMNSHRWTRREFTASLVSRMVEWFK